MKTQNEINFDGVIATPLRRWKDVTMRLDDDVVAFLRELAARANQPFDNVLNHIMTDFLSEHLDLEKISAKTLEAIAAKSSHIILMEGTKPFARVEIISPKTNRPFAQTNPHPFQKIIVPQNLKRPTFTMNANARPRQLKSTRKNAAPLATGLARCKT